MLHSSQTFFIAQIRCSKHSRWTYYHFDFHSQMNRWKCNSTLIVLLMVSTNRGLVLIIASTSSNRMFRDSSSKLLLWVLKRDVKMILLADLICLSKVPPMRLPKGEFLFHTIQSAFWLSMNPWILLWFVSSMDFANSLSAPTKLLPLLNWIFFALHDPAMKRLRASINESVSILFVISVWRAQLTKQINSSP